MPNSPSILPVHGDDGHEQPPPIQNALRGLSRPAAYKNGASARRACAVRPPLHQPWAVATPALGPPFAGTVVDRTRRSVVALQSEAAVECRMCHKEIHPERLAMNARVRTCSHACAAGLRKRGKAEAVARLRARRREAQGVKGPDGPEARLGHGRGNQRASVPGPLAN